MAKKDNPSAAYWAKREREALQYYVTDEAEYDKQINKIYTNMLANCQKEINAFYGRYADKENITIAEAKKRVSSMDIKAYEAKAERYVKDKTFSKEANEEMRLYNATMRINRLEMLKANIGLELIAGGDDLEKFMEGILKGRTEAELKRQAGILGKTITNNAQLAHSIVNASFHNATFSQRIWNNSAAMKADLDKLIQSGLIQGKNANVLAKDLQKYFIGEPRLKNGKKGAKYRAEVLMRTELARVQTEAQKQSFIRNGFSQYQFIVNGNCCDICRDIANKDVGFGKGIFLVKDMMPGENASPVHPLCRCSTAAYSDRAEYEAWLDFLESGGTTKEWEASAKAKWEKRNSKLGAGKNNGDAIRSTKTKIGEIDASKASEAISYFNEQIRNAEVENAVVIDKNGNVYQFVGNENSVDIYDVDLEGAFITHNHPKSEGIVSFGEDDFVFIKNNPKIGGIGCCNEEYDYSIKVLKPMENVVYNNIYMEGLEKAFEPDFEPQDAAMQVLAEKGYVEYEKRKVK